MRRSRGQIIRPSLRLSQSTYGSVERAEPTKFGLEFEVGCFLEVLGVDHQGRTGVTGVTHDPAFGLAVG
jgi:hypothetical protein